MATERGQASKERMQSVLDAININNANWANKAGVTYNSNASGTNRSFSTNTKSSSPFNGKDYRWWVGTDGNVWANVEGTGVVNMGKYNGLKSDNIYGNSKMIADPNKQSSSTSSTSATSNTGSSSTYSAEEAARKSKAQQIKNAMLGREGEFKTSLDTILEAIKAAYGEESSKLTEQYDKDKAKLIDSLAAALPEIGNSYAAMGAYDSSQRALSNIYAREQEKEAEEELQQEYDTNAANLGSKMEDARNAANTSYNNFMIDMNTLRDTEANSDNLERLRSSQNSLLKGLNEFGAQAKEYQTGTSFKNALAAENTYSGEKAKQSLQDYLTQAGASGIKSNTGTGSIASTVSQKKDKSELEQNKSTGASK